MQLDRRMWTVGAMLAAASPAVAQSNPRPEDVATLDGVIKAYYEVVTGPAGQPRDWARDRSLHHPQAQVVIVAHGPDGRAVANVMTLAEYHERSGALADQGFFEREIHRVTETHGAVTHVWSTYEWRGQEDGPVGGRGVNSIHLVHDGERWWITSWMFDGRDDAPPVPPEYLPDDLR